MRYPRSFCDCSSGKRLVCDASRVVGGSAKFLCVTLRSREERQPRFPASRVVWEVRRSSCMYRYGVAKDGNLVACFACCGRFGEVLVCVAVGSRRTATWLPASRLCEVFGGVFCWYCFDVVKDERLGCSASRL